MRNARELYCMWAENVDFDAGTFFTPGVKTASGRRYFPMGSRVKQIMAWSPSAGTSVAVPISLAPSISASIRRCFTPS
jgi:hypothetical protein